MLNDILDFVRHEVVSNPSISDVSSKNLLSFLELIKINEFTKDSLNDVLRTHSELVVATGWIYDQWVARREKLHADLYKRFNVELRNSNSGRVTEAAIEAEIMSETSYVEAFLLSRLYDRLKDAVTVRGKMLEQLSNNTRQENRDLEKNA